MNEFEMNQQMEMGDDHDMMINMDEGGLFGLTPAQINAILQRQGFSFQTFMEMPADLQADILQNVQLEGQLQQTLFNQANRQPGQNPIA